MKHLPAVLLLLFAGTTLAQATAGTDEDKSALTARAEAIRARAEAMRDQAERDYQTEHAACWKRFLVSRCQDQARSSYNEALVAARREEDQARAIERDIRRRDLEARDAEAPARIEDKRQQADEARKERKAQGDALERKNAERAAEIDERKGSVPQRIRAGEAAAAERQTKAAWPRNSAPRSAVPPSPRPMQSARSGTASVPRRRVVTRKRRPPPTSCSRNRAPSDS